MRLLITTLFICTLSLSQAQLIPNAGLENWDFNGWNYSPSDWQSNNSQLFQDVFQDSAAYSGEWAARIESFPNGVGEYGSLSVQMDIDYIPASLDLYVKYERTLTAGLGIEVTFYNGANMVSTANWSPQGTVSAWVPLQIPFDQIEPGITHVIITAYVSIGDFAPGDGWLAIDDLSFAGVTGVEGAEKTSLSLYPNPASDLLRVSGLQTQTLYRIIDAAGRVVLEGMTEGELNIEALAQGSYSLMLIGEEPSAIGFSVER